jgi:DNA helicase MCM9
VPKSVKVLLENDLVDSCKAGDDVTINATVIERWNRLVAGSKNETEIILHANYIKVNNEDETYVNITAVQVKINFFM